ncbi:MAG: signal recognition particle-docking protein FtsY [bacterium]|nr:signal recognition particle-docking protein FtsY [bacterium]
MGLLNKLAFNLKKAVFGKAKISQELLDEHLQELLQELIEQDVDLEVAEQLLENIKKKLAGAEITRHEDLEERVREAALELVPVELLHWSIFSWEPKKKPSLLLFFGINGSGKTTALAKAGKILAERGFRVLLVAGDTFRAASIEQLEQHAKQLKLPLFKGQYGQDPAAVIYSALQHAEKRLYDIVLADTSGRMPTNENLVRELQKVVRVNEPELKLLVLDLSQGRDVYQQLELYEQAVGIDALILTKYDVDPKPGVLLSLLSHYKKPVFFVSCGQDYTAVLPVSKALAQL